MRPALRALSPLLLAAAGVVAGSCLGDDGPRISELTLSVWTPNPDDRAVIVLIHGEVASIVAADGFEVFVGEAGTTVSVIVIPEVTQRFPARDIPVAAVFVEDASAASHFTVAVVEVATTGYQIRPEAHLAEYRASLTRAGGSN